MMEWEKKETEEGVAGGRYMKAGNGTGGEPRERKKEKEKKIIKGSGQDEDPESQNDCQRGQKTQWKVTSACIIEVPEGRGILRNPVLPNLRTNPNPPNSRHRPTGSLDPISVQ